MTRTIREEPLGVKEINDAIDRCDELLNIGDPLPEVRNRDPTYRTIKDQIRKTEEILFRMKRQLADLHRPTGTPILYAANFHNCSTCYNERCVHWLGKKNPNPIINIVQNIMKDVGCLAWLPPKEGP